MILSRFLIDLWDPELRARNRERCINVLQIITLPFLFVGLILSFTIDVITLPWQLRMIYNNE